MYSDGEDYEVLAFMCVIVNFRSFKLKAQNIIIQRTLFLSTESLKKIDASLNVNVR